MTDDELKQMAADLRILKGMIPAVPAAPQQAIQDVVVPAIQTVVPVLTNVVAPALLSVDQRLNLLMQSYVDLTTEVSAIKTEVAKLVSALAPQ